MPTTFGLGRRKGFASVAAWSITSRWVADRVVIVDVPPGQQRHAGGHRRHLLVEHLVAQALGAADLGNGGGEADFEIADAAEDRVEPRRGEGLLQARLEPDRRRTGGNQRPGAEAEGRKVPECRETRMPRLKAFLLEPGRWGHGHAPPSH